MTQQESAPAAGPRLPGSRAVERRDFVQGTWEASSRGRPDKMVRPVRRLLKVYCKRLGLLSRQVDI